MVGSTSKHGTIFPRLKDWFIIAADPQNLEAGQFVITGKVHGHNTLPDGAEITTGPVFKSIGFGQVATSETGIFKLEEPNAEKAEEQGITGDIVQFIVKALPAHSPL